MWNNGNLKRAAKQHLSTSYGVAIFVMLIFFFLSGFINKIFRLAGASPDLKKLMSTYTQKLLNGQNIDYLEFITLLNATFQNTVLISIVFSVARTVIFDPLSMSTKNWFLRNREIAGFPPINMILEHFTSNYLNLLWASFYKNLLVFIWALPITLAQVLQMIWVYDYFEASVIYKDEGFLELLPKETMILVFTTLFALVWAVVLVNRIIAYSMMGYLLADNPNLEAKTALGLSEKMMKGNKLHYFGLRLSFFFWYLLANFLNSLNLGNILLAPYIEQTFAELYASLRTQAVSMNYITMEDLGFTRSN